jgi:transposase
LTYSEILIGLPGYQITGIEQIRKQVRIGLRYEGGPVVCPHCGVGERRSKGWCVRAVRHDDWGLRPVVLQIELRKWLCKGCGRQYRDRLPGILPSQRASEAFQQAIYEAHLDGINRSRLGRRKGIGAATVERYFQHGRQRQFAQWHPPKCPLVLGIDEHFFTRRKGYATTFSI